MIKLQELFKGQDVCSIDVKKQDYKQLLEYLKQEDCLWRNGEIINPKDKISSSTVTIIITSDLLIHKYVPYWSANYFLQNRPNYSFDDLKKDKIIDNTLIKKEKAAKKLEQYEQEQKAKRLAFEKKCEINRLISKSQIQDKTNNN